ncbi:MAG: flagellin FliC [Deltaproteobacteria bacterium]|nr:flagellin FliC [Deltaproteobacteria bacterium]
MALKINTNIPSLRSDREISKKTAALNKNFESLASGKRINRASDDPAGLSIALALQTSASVSDVARRNINDAVSASNIAEGAISTASDISARLSELASQASNGVLSDEQRESLNSEFNALRSELDRISQTTEFNGQQLLGGSANFVVQAGTDGSSNSQISVPFPSVSAAGLGLSSNLSSQASARQALDETRAAVDRLAQSRGDIGATVSRLEVANENLRASSVNERDAASQILDADIAEQAAQLTANRIGQQAAVAVKAQANLTSQLALRLLS